MTTNNEPLPFGNPGSWITEVQPPVVLVTSAVPKPRAKGQALWNPFSLRRLSRFAPFSPVEKENVGAGTVSETVSKRGSRVVKNSGELNQIIIEFTGVFAILLKLNHAFRSQRDPAHRPWLRATLTHPFGFKIQSGPRYLVAYQPHSLFFTRPEGRLLQVVDRAAKTLPFLYHFQFSAGKGPPDGHPCGGPPFLTTNKH